MREHAGLYDVLSRLLASFEPKGLGYAGVLAHQVAYLAACSAAPAPMRLGRRLKRSATQLGLDELVWLLDHESWHAPSCRDFVKRLGYIVVRDADDHCERILLEVWRLALTNRRGGLWAAERQCRVLRGLALSWSTTLRDEDEAQIEKGHALLPPEMRESPARDLYARLVTDLALGAA